MIAKIITTIVILGTLISYLLLYFKTDIPTTNLFIIFTMIMTVTATFGVVAQIDFSKVGKLSKKSETYKKLLEKVRNESHENAIALIDRANISNDIKGQMKNNEQIRLELVKQSDELRLKQYTRYF